MGTWRCWSTNENVYVRIDVWAACRECPPSWVRCLSLERGKENHARVNNHHQDTQRFWDVEQFEPRANWSCGQTLLSKLEDVDELMLAKPWCDHAESPIPPLGETDIAAVLSVFDAQNFSLLLSRVEEIEVLRSQSQWNPGGGAYDNSATRNTGKGKGIQKRERPTEVNTTLASAGGDSRIEIPQPRIRSQRRWFRRQTMQSCSRTWEAWAGSYLTRMIQMWVSSLYLKTIRSFCVTWMTWWIRVQTSVTDTEPSEKWTIRWTSTSRYRRFSPLTKLLMSLLRYNDKFRREPPRPRHLSNPQDDRSGGDADQSRPKLSPNTAGQKGRMW